MGELFAKAKLQVILVVCCFMLLPFLLKSSTMEESKATWLWDAALIENHTDNILSFCKEQGVDVIFLQIQKKVDDKDYHRFIAAAYDEGITVHALDGRPDWAYERQRKEGDRFLQWVIDYNGEASPNERFAGAQLDVEPYQLKRWEREQADVVREWSSNIQAWVAKGRDNGLYMSAAVPFWLGKIDAADNKGNLSRWMISEFDAVAVMSYRDTGKQIYDLSREQLQEADRLGKAVWVGMELGESKEGPHVSFFSKAVPVMEEEMLNANRLSENHPSFAGLAVHHYEVWYDKVEALAAPEDDHSKKDE